MATTTSLLPNALPDAWRGAVGWEQGRDGWRAWRLLPALADQAFAPELIRHATMASGVRAEVVTGADHLEIDLLLDVDRLVRLDVVVDGTLHERVPMTAGTLTTTVGLPAGGHHVEVWLPQTGQTWLRALAVDGEAVPAPRPRTRWLTYGSSITHCDAAAGPSRTWPAIVARNLGWDLTSLGFGGQCHLDPVAATTIAVTPSDVVSLCLGINIQGGSTFSERTLGGQVAAFVAGVRAAHPAATLVLMTPITSPPREHAPNAVGLDLTGIRRILGEVHAVLAADDPRLHLVHGPDVIGPDDAHLLPDELHPDAEGYALMGERLTTLLGAAHADASGATA